MADNQEIPLYQKFFLGEADVEYIDSEDIQPGLLKRTTNLTPARKIGSLVQFGGTSFFKLNGVQLTTANLPHPTGYELVDFYSFSVDRDEKEVMILIYVDTNGQTKFYVNPFYNPEATYNNHDYSKPIGWVNEWFELTQTFSTLVAADVASPTARVFTIDSPPAVNLTGWFLWNKTKQEYHLVRFHTISDANIGTFGAVGTFDDNDEVFFYRFPVLHYYSADIPVPGNTVYTHKGEAFNAIPTQFHYGLNELRMPCGKDKRPLILIDIFQRKYFQDGNILAPEGYVNSISLATTDENLSAIPAVSFSAGNATAKVSYMRAGTATTINAGGTGYFLGDVIQTTKGTVPAEFIVTGVGVNGAITNISLHNGGKFYGTLPTNPVDVIRKYTGGGGDTDTFPMFQNEADAPGASVNLTYAVGGFQILNPGSGYAAAPSVVITPAVATATCTIITAGTGINVGMKYDGLWFDFQQIPQVLYKNAVSAFGDLTYSGVQQLYLYAGRNPGATPPEKPLSSVVIPGFPNFITMVWTRVELLTVGVLPYDAGTPSEGIIYNTTNFAFALRNNNTVFLILIKAGVTPPTLQEIYDGYYSGVGYGLVWGLSMSITGTTTANVNRYPLFDNLEYVSANTLIMAGGEAGDNLVSENKFLGTKCKVVSVGSGALGANKYLTPLIITTVYDFRNEVVIANGRILANVASTSDYQDAFQVQFNPWFSRRITGFKVYTGDSVNTSDGLDLEAAVAEYAEYPWFFWTQNHYVNEFGLLKQCSIEQIITPFNAQMPNQLRYARVLNAGLNCYTFDSANNIWFTKLEQNYQGIADAGPGLRFLDETGRTIDQDTTMNYTRITYAGEINGRYFITGCKNTVEKILYENNDAVLYSVFGAGISHYDTFVRVKSAITGIGTKDINRGINYYNGFLVIVKDSSVYFLDVNTDEDLRYRVVATQLGRGVINPDAIVYTPHGIVVPSKDGVYLINPTEGPRQILHQANGRLAWYRSYFANQSVMGCYSNEYDEVFLIQRATASDEESYVMIYNFQNDRWTTVAYNTAGRAGNTVHVRGRIGQDKSILFLNSYNGAANIVKFDEQATGYLNVNGSEQPIEFILETHKVPYGEKIFDVIPKGVTLHYSANVSGSRRLDATFTKRIGNSIGLADNISSTETDRVANLLTYTNNAQDMLGLIVTNSSGGVAQKFNSFTLNSYIIWITKQRRLLKQT